MAESFDLWAIVEVMGHKRFSGHVSEQSIGGASFIRVDVPATKRAAAFTKLLGAASIYCISPCSEEIAKADAESNVGNPLSELSLPLEMREDMAAGRKLRTVSHGQRKLTFDSPEDDDGPYDDDEEY